MRLSVSFFSVLLSVLGALGGGYAMGMSHPVREPPPGLIPGSILLIALGLILLVRHARQQGVMRAEERRQEAEMELAYRSAPIGLAMVDRDLNYIRINQHLADINGAPIEKHLGKNIYEIVPEVASRQEHLLREVLESGEPKLNIAFETTLPDAPDVMRDWRVYIYPLRDDAGQVVGLNFAANEVTALRHAEKALLEEAKRKDEFLAMLGHELRNPLAPLQSGVDLMGMLKIDNPVYDDVRQAMARQVAHLTRLVDGLLEGSRILRGKIELQVEVVDAAPILLGCAQAYEARAAAAGLTLEADLPAAPVWVKGDSVRLTQVFSNLLDNAIKYGRRGGWVRLSAQVSAEQLAVQVEDDGAGIPASFLPHVFSVFVQANHHNSCGGLGLGLSIARRMVELHGGDIQIESQGENLGTRVSVQLPLSSESTRPAPPVTTLRQGGNGRHVLLVDDNVDAASSLGTLLAMLGCEVQSAHDGASALVLALSVPASLVLLDIGLPDTDGYTLLQRLKDYPHLAQAQFAAITGYGQEHDQRRAKEAGFDFHLTKPVSLVQLENLLTASSLRPEAGKVEISSSSAGEL
jgi:PAS domain S-box-containing protein